MIIKTMFKLCSYRGADPNDPGPRGITPLMIACKHGRDENVKELVAIDDQNIDDILDNGEPKKPRVTIDVKNKHTKAAIHYAASNGHLVSPDIICYIVPVSGRLSGLAMSIICVTFLDKNLL